jgi:L-lactate dehydrogenase
MVPIWSSATVAGLPLEQFPGCNPQLMKDAFEETKTAGATMIKLKGGSGFAVGVSIAEVVQSIILDSRKILPVSSLQNGLYGVHDVCLSVPTEVGCGGVRKLFELALTPKERIGIQQSGKLLREIIDQVEARIGNPNSVAIGASSPINPQSNPQGKILPRSAWQPSRKY